MVKPEPMAMEAAPGLAGLKSRFLGVPATAEVAKPDDQNQPDSSRKSGSRGVDRLSSDFNVTPAMSSSGRVDRDDDSMQGADTEPSVPPPTQYQPALAEAREIDIRVYLRMALRMAMGAESAFVLERPYEEDDSANREEEKKRLDEYVAYRPVGDDVPLVFDAARGGRPPPEPARTSALGERGHVDTLRRALANLFVSPASS